MTDKNLCSHYSKKLVDEDTVAVGLDKSKRCLQTWRQLGIGPPYYKIGHNVRYDMDEVISWLHEQQRIPMSTSGNKGSHDE